MAPAPSLTPQVAFINDSGQRCGDDRFALLAAIDQLGTLSAAAKQVGLSYKAAWDGINALNNLFEKPLVEKQAGGKHGGGCTLTEDGHRALAFHHQFHQAMAVLIANLSTLPAPFYGALPMKTSARNAYHGRIRRLVKGAVNTEVLLDISSQNTLTAVITNQSAADMELAEGLEVYALIKASAPILMAAGAGQATSARNQLRGTVQQAERGAVNGEVILDLGEGKTLCAIVTNDSLDSLDIQPGQDLVALIKSSQIILAGR